MSRQKKEKYLFVKKSGNKFIKRILGPGFSLKSCGTIIFFYFTLIRKIDEKILSVWAHTMRPYKRTFLGMYKNSFVIFSKY